MNHDEHGRKLVAYLVLENGNDKASRDEDMTVMRLWRDEEGRTEKEYIRRGASEAGARKLMGIMDEIVSILSDEAERGDRNFPTDGYPAAASIPRDQ